MSRLPIRLRLTLAFALAMAGVVAAAGALLYVRVGDSLLEQVDESLATRAQALVAAVRSGAIEETLPGHEEEFAQVLSSRGAVVAATAGFDVPLLPPARRSAAAERRLLVEAEVSPPGEDGRERARLLVVPTGHELVVVGASLEDRADALDGLLAQLVVGGPLALLLACAAGYLLAGGALRPVETMRRRAAAISAETSGDRLPLPPARDELHRLGTTLNAMLDRLDAGLRRERRFVADAGHELRTPLSVLRTELELALRRPRTRDELEAALGSAAEEVERLVRLSEDLLVLAAAEDGRLALQRSRFAARDLLDDVARRFRGRAAVSARTIEVAGAPNAELEGDRLRLEQALGNLVDNALRHGGGVVRLGAAREDGRMLLRVGDDGSGFPPAFLAHAFERFSRADAARTVPGAGLGLAIVIAVARAHGGEAYARNGSHGGAEVTIAVPHPAR